MVHTKATVYLVIAIFVLLLGVGAFAAARRLPFWLRCSFLFIGILGIPYGWLGFTLEYYRSSLPFRTRVYLDHYITLVAGATMGAFVVLVIYGLVSVYVKRRDTDLTSRSS
jgi:hypothetical protein